MLKIGFIFALTWMTITADNIFTKLSYIPLNDGYRIPRIGFGTFGKVSEMDSVARAVVTAVECGYRLIDAAYFHENKKVVGNAIRNVITRGIVNRRDLFITSKLNTFTGRDAVIEDLLNTLEEMKLDYLDLFLIRFPRNQTTGEDFPYLDIWKGMEDVKRLGLTKSIGVANFNATNINNILSNSNIKPAVNQIEVNPTMANLGLVSYCLFHNIRVMSYAPFGFAVPRPFNNKTLAPSFYNPTLVKIANKYGKTTSQVMLRYLMDRYTIPIPKSTNRQHIKSNINVFNFALTIKEIYKINEFDIDTGVYLQNGLLPPELFTYINNA